MPSEGWTVMGIGFIASSMPAVELAVRKKVGVAIKSVSCWKCELHGEQAP